jgi:hypothetical protein
MDCSDLAKIFAGDHEADLEGSQDRLFTDHLSACAACRDTLAGAEGQLDTLVQLVEPEPLPDAAWDRVTAAIRTELEQAPITSFEDVRARRKRSPMPVFLAAVAAVLFLVGVAFMNRLAQPTTAPDNHTTSSLELHTADAEATLVEAGDGYKAGAEVHGQLLCLWVKEAR